jgi:hypothetical protein
MVVIRWVVWFVYQLLRFQVVLGLKGPKKQIAGRKVGRNE